VNGSLPWRGLSRHDVGQLKESISDEDLCAGCPPAFLEMIWTLKSLTYYDTPPYSAFANALKRDLAATEVNLESSFGWDTDRESDTVCKLYRRLKTLLLEH
jgi:hypothetical protein